MREVGCVCVDFCFDCGVCALAEGCWELVGLGGV